MSAKQPIESKPWYPTKYSVADVVAFQAIEKGEASPDQQKRVVEWLVSLTGLNDLSYRPDSQRDTDFAEGKRFVGLQIRKMLILNPKALMLHTEK